MAIVRFPFPLIACLTNFSDKYRQLLRNGDEFAFRLLFIYSCLCVISRIPLNRNDNIFVDYISEFKNIILVNMESLVTLLMRIISFGYTN